MSDVTATLAAKDAEIERLLALIKTLHPAHEQPTLRKLCGDLGRYQKSKAVTR